MCIRELCLLNLNPILRNIKTIMIEEQIYKEIQITIYNFKCKLLFLFTFHVPDSCWVMYISVPLQCTLVRVKSIIRFRFVVLFT